MNRKIYSFLVLTVLYAAFFPSCSDTEKPVSPYELQKEEIIEVLRKKTYIGEFVAALKDVDFDAIRSEELTIFAVMNSGMGQSATKPADDNILLRHIVKGKYTRSLLTDGLKLTALDGSTLSVSNTEGKIYINGVEPGEETQIGEHVVVFIVEKQIPATPPIPPVFGSMGVVNNTLTGTSAQISVQLEHEGTPACFEYGICYATTPNPTIAQKKVMASAMDNGKFTVNLTGLSPSTTYYMRAFANNGAGNIYFPAEGTDATFTTTRNYKIATWPPEDTKFDFAGYPGITGLPADREITVHQNVWTKDQKYRQKMYALDPGDWYIVANANTYWGGVRSYPCSGWIMDWPEIPVKSIKSMVSSWEVDFSRDNTKVAAWACYDLWFNSWKIEVMITVAFTAPWQYQTVHIDTAEFNGQIWHLQKFGDFYVWKCGADDKNIVNMFKGELDLQPFLVWLEDKGHLPKGSTWTAGGFGFEICDTRGIDQTFSVKDFKVQIKR